MNTVVIPGVSTGWVTVRRYDDVIMGRVLVDSSSGLGVVVGYAPVVGVTDDDLARALLNCE